MRSASLVISVLLVAAPLMAAGKNQKNVAHNPAVQDPDHDYARLKFDDKGNPLPAPAAAADAAKADLDAAKAALTKAIGGAGGKETYQIDNALMKDDDYRAALFNLRRAEADYDSVRKPIFDALRQDSEYKQLLEYEESNQQAMQALVIMGHGNFDWLFPTALASLEIRKRMTHEEIIALAQEPEVEDARSRMLQAAAKVRNLRAAYMNENVNGTAAKAAQEDLDQARLAVQKAQTAYSAALADAAEYERIRQNYLVEANLTGKPPTIAAK